MAEAHGGGAQIHLHALALAGAHLAQPAVLQRGQQRQQRQQRRSEREH
jgi:hypothetical protein